MSSDQVACARKRRRSRIEKSIPLAVQGVDSFRAFFREKVTTVAIGCHGCSYQTKHEAFSGRNRDSEHGAGGEWRLGLARASACEMDTSLLTLSQSFEGVAQDSVHTLIASSTDHEKKNLEENAVKISGNFTSQPEARIRNDLEFIGDSIAEFPKKTSTL